MTTVRITSVALLAAALPLSSAMAADAIIYEPAPIVTQEEIASAFDVAFGVALTSRYVSRGFANSSGAVLQGYVEASYDWAYIGVWASGVGGPDLDPDNVEIDIYGGIRPTFGDLTVDIGYVRYLYDETGDCCGEAYIKPSYQFTDEFSAGLELYHDFDSDGSYGVVTAAYALPYDFTISAGVGTRFESGPDTDWNVGLSYTFADLITIDGRYHDSDFNRDYFTATIALDTSFSSVREMFAGGQFGGGR